MPITVRHLGPITAPPPRPPSDNELGQIRIPCQDEILQALRAEAPERNELRAALIEQRIIHSRDLECSPSGNRRVKRVIEEIQSSYRKSLESAEKTMLEFQERFLNRAFELAETDIIPISRNEIRRRLGRLTIAVTDPIKTKDTDPEFVQNTLTIKMPVPVLAGRFFYDDFAHEALHGLAGEDYVEATISNGDAATTQELRTCRRGLYFDVPMPNGRNILFSWLDEGLIEHLLGFFVLRCKRSENCYPDEVDIIKTLTDSEGRYRVPLRKLTEAYFANYDASAPNGKRYPEWSELNKFLPIKTLNQINRIIEEKGERAGAKWLRQG